MHLAPSRAVCGTPARVASGPIRPLDKGPRVLPTKTPPAGDPGYIPL